MKPICVPCQRFFEAEKTGYYFIEGMPNESGAKPGKSEPEKWVPYKLWSGDLWKCPGCSQVIICGTGQHPIAEHYEERFQRLANDLDANQFQVNDC